MIKLKYSLFGIIVVLIFTTCSSTEDYVTGNYHGRQHHTAMLTYVVSKGCAYLSGFVQSVYARSHNSKDANCDWQGWVSNKCSALHIPSTICQGLMSCGTACAMSALRAPPTMMETCNITSISVHTFDMMGKRSHVDYSSLHFCASSTSGSHFAFGRREVSSGDEQRPDQGDSSVRNNGHVGVAAQLSVSRKGLRRWCTNFSKFIRNKYHFNEVKFVRSSPYWLVDVYKIGPKFGVPLWHTHGLVGCGMEYALSALNAPSWMSVFYSSSNK